MRATPLLLLGSLLVACGGEGAGPTPPPPPGPPSPLPPASLTIVAGDQQTGSLNSPTPVAPAVVVRNAQGGPVPGVTVTFVVEAGGGSVEQGAVVTAADGVARPGAWLLGPLPGVNRLRASAGALSASLQATAELKVPVTEVSGSVALPPGATLSPGSLRIVHALTEVEVSSAGTFTTVVPQGEVQLAAAHTAANQPVLFAWLDETARTLGVRSTAEVMAYFDAGGFMLPDSAHRRQLRQLIATGVALGPLEAAISQALLAAPGTLTLDVPAIREARIAVVQALAAQASAAPARAMQVDPSAQQSGVAVDQTGFRNVTITNAWRRRVVAFVDRIAYTPKGGGAEIPSPLPGGPLRIGAVTSATSVIGTVVDLLFGTFAWVPVVAPVQTLPLFPVDALRTRYRVTVVGGGLPNSAVPLTALQGQKQIEAEAETILFDLLVPLIDQLLNAHNLARVANDQQELDTILHKFLDLNPTNLLAAIGNGDWMGFWNELLKLLFDTGGGQSFIIEAFIVPNAAKTGLEAIKSVDDAVERFVKPWSRALTAVEVLATTADIAFVLKGLADARRAEAWEVTVNAATISLSPEVLHISPDESPNITVFVHEATGGTSPQFLYRWSTTGQAGKLCGQDTNQGGNYCGTLFDTPRDIVAYAPHGLVGGTDQVKVEVWLKEGNVYHVVGEATMSVTVHLPEVRILPANQSILPGNWATYTAQVDEGLEDGGTLSYRWTTPGAYGAFAGGATDLEVPQVSMAYHARNGVEGTDPITLTVYSTKDGVKRTVGSAQGTAEVTQTPTIVMGTWLVGEPVGLDAGRQCVAAYLTFPLVTGAVSYELHAYGFNDTAAWGTEIQETFQPPFEPWIGCSLAGWGRNGANASAYWMMLTGFAGPQASIGNAIGTFQSRFAGMTVEVKVRY